MSKQSHLIIGSNSFLGHSLSKKLLLSGVDVLGVFNKNKNNLFKDIKHIQISELDVLKDTFDVVYIISAFVPNKNSNAVAKTLTKVNVDLVQIICNQFKSAKIVFCSSVSVYKESQDVITETSITEPESDYGISKLKGEAIVKKQNKYAIIRISSMYGLNMKQTTFLPLVIKHAIKKKEITLFGDGSRLQNYIHVDDVAQYLLQAAKLQTNAILLATSKDSVSNKSLAQIIKEWLPETKIRYKGIDESKSYLYNNFETKSKINITEEKELKKELQNIIEWMKKES